MDMYWDTEIISTWGKRWNSSGHDYEIYGQWDENDEPYGWMDITDLDDGRHERVWCDSWDKIHDAINDMEDELYYARRPERYGSPEDESDSDGDSADDSSSSSESGGLGIGYFVVFLIIAFIAMVISKVFG